MNRKIVALFGLFLSISVVLSSILWFSLNQVDELQNQTNIIKYYNVRIAGFCVQPPDVLAWGFVAWSFNVTVQNLGRENVSGVTLVVKMFNKETELWNYTSQLDTLEIEEKRVIYGRADTGMDAWSAYMEKYKIENPQNNVSYNATLILNGLVLDEATI